MYNDYPTVYETNINQNFIYYIIFGVILLLLLLVTLISLSRVFKKTNRSGLTAYIPIVNLIPLIEITNLSKIYFVLLLIPVLNLPFWIKTNLKLANSFKKSTSFGLGLSFLPFIFYPILGFSDSEYIGINLVAMTGKTTVEDIPVIDINKNNPIEVEVNDQADTSTNSINMSIGGGVYQKDYTNNLLNVSDEKVVNASMVEEDPTGTKFSDKRILDVNFSNMPIEEKKEEINTNNFTVDYIKENTVVQNNTPVNTQVKPKEESTIMKNINNVEYNKTDPLKENPDDYKLCPNCKTRVQDGAKMCFICGQTID